MDQTLLLNATYEPLMIIDWRRAVTLLFLGKSEVLEEYQREVRSPSQTLRVPAVMRLHTRVRAARPTVRFSRQNIYARDRHRCQYCGERFNAAALTFDHVLPRSKGGRTSWKNIVTCCVPCNRYKANRTPAQAGMALLREPFKPDTLSGQGRLDRVDPPPSWSFYLWARRRGRAEGQREAAAAH